MYIDTYLSHVVNRNDNRIISICAHPGPVSRIIQFTTLQLFGLM